jgi:hypothetical protein
MDKAELSKPMTEWDWHVLGYKCRKNDLLVLPKRRIDIPLPCTVTECHTIAHRLAALSQAIGQEARLATANRNGILMVGQLIEQARLQFAQLGTEWEREFREREDEKKNSASHGEHLRAVE